MMAARTSNVLRSIGQIARQKASLSTQAASSRSLLGNKLALSLAAVGAGGAALVYTFESGVAAGEHVLHPTKVPWSHLGVFNTLDYHSVRRGYQVYKQVCAACHTQMFIRYRHFTNVFMSSDEVKEEAASVMIPDTDDLGKAIMRPGVPNDLLPPPYPNDKAAAAANNGAIPPDLSCITLARHGAEDYVFALLTGYVDAPVGVVVEEGKAYNPYFPGNIISMTQQLFDDGIEYDDGTPATMSQQAKDVCTYLAWTAEPFFDARKNLGLKGVILSVPMLVVILYLKRHQWSFLKTQRFSYRYSASRDIKPTYKPKGPPPQGQ